MSEKLLHDLLKLFAIIAKVDSVTQEVREVVQELLENRLQADEVVVYLKIFDAYVLEVDSNDFLEVAEEIAAELQQRQKYIIILYLIILVLADGDFSEGEQELIRQLPEIFRIRPSFVGRLIKFVRCTNLREYDHQNIIVINDDPDTKFKRANHIQVGRLDGDLGILRVPGIELYLFKYIGDDDVQLNHNFILPGKHYALVSGSVLNLPQEKTIYFSDILRYFIDVDHGNTIALEVKNITYSFPNGNLGLHPFTFNENSGSLVAIMGASGSGKSTLLNVLNGTIRPTSGEVLINGINLHDYLEGFKSLIGYVPQDDLLIEELTVLQNLYFNARLIYGDHNKAEITRLVLKVLEELGLSETMNLRVGSPMDKTISGGQRKRLNIGLELLRQPEVIFFDEPTSGLSSRDSENIMGLLKELTLKGKLLYTVIHQPSSEIFKLFDKLIILDKGGYPIYQGNPIRAVSYFKHQAKHIHKGIAACPECGNINSEQIFDIIESPVIDEYGRTTHKRKYTPEEWYESYKENIVVGKAEKPDRPPVITTSFPSWAKQFIVYLKRDALTKLGNLQYCTINGFVAPILALILAALVRFYHAEESISSSYIFGNNDNIPVYFFMSIVVALFIGMTMSAEEILRDRKILRREKFLNLERSSYLTSKITILFSIGAVQMLLFILVGHIILKIPGLYVEYWLLLFSIISFAIILGLNISSTFSSAVTIYILIPLLIIPQLILSGTMVRFDKLNPAFGSPETVPFAADIMASRWGYEALMVKFFKDNAYEKNFYEEESRLSKGNYRKSFWVPRLNKTLDDCLRYKAEDSDSALEKMEKKLALLDHELRKEAQLIGEEKMQILEALNRESFTPEVVEGLRDILGDVKSHYIDQVNDSRTERDESDRMLRSKFKNNAAFVRFKKRYHNKAVAAIVRNKDSERLLLESEGKLIRMMDPVFFADERPQHWLDYRCHFYAPEKHLFGIQINTFTFNILVIWLMTFGLYITLYYELGKKLVDRITRPRS